MLRISFVETSDTCTLKLEGWLDGGSARHLRAVIQDSIPQPPQLEVDLRGVTFVDGQGELILVWLHRMGARFRSSSIYTDCLCSMLGIPPMPKPTGSDDSRLSFEKAIS